jgi:hypothetical protein
MTKTASNMINRGRMHLIAVLMTAGLILTASVPSFARDFHLYSGRVYALDTNVYYMTFIGGEWEVLEVQGDGNTDLDLYVYNSRGGLVAKDVRAGAYAGVRWIPCCTERFTVRVVNRGRVASNYVLSTN